VAGCYEDSSESSACLKGETLSVQLRGYRESRKTLLCEVRQLEPVGEAK
jgi:hypothetical protein